MKGKKAEQAEEDKDPGINCRRDLTHFLHKGRNGFNHSLSKISFDET